METIEFKTPSGYIATIKSEISYGEFIDLQKAITKSVSVNIDDIKNPKLGAVDASIVYERNAKALEIMVKKLVYPNGEESTNIPQTIYEMPRRDGDSLMAKINEITSENTVDEKKGGK